VKIGNVRWVDNQGYMRELHLELDGHAVHIHDGQKPTLVKHGILSVLSFDGWTESLPEITLPADPEAGHTEHVLSGCIQDQSVFALWREMVDASPEEFQARATYSDGTPS
jgi:hypothetical protein